MLEVPPLGAKLPRLGLRLLAVCRQEASVEVPGCRPLEGGGRTAAAADEAPLTEKRGEARRRRRLTAKVRGGRWARRRGRTGGVMCFLRSRRGRPGVREGGGEGAGWGPKAGCKGEPNLACLAVARLPEV